MDNKMHCQLSSRPTVFDKVQNLQYFPAILEKLLVDHYENLFNHAEKNAKKSTWENNCEEFLIKFTEKLCRIFGYPLEILIHRVISEALLFMMYIGNNLLQKILREFSQCFSMTFLKLFSGESLDTPGFKLKRLW